LFKKKNPDAGGGGGAKRTTNTKKQKIKLKITKKKLSTRRTENKKNTKTQVFRLLRRGGNFGTFFQKRGLFKARGAWDKIRHSILKKCPQVFGAPNRFAFSNQ